jgi:cell division protein FtsN
MMPTMVTFRAGTRALIALALVGAAACSYEQQDWRSAESADTSEAWARFVDQHPDSELVSQARARIAQLAELRDWRDAERMANVEAYRAFLARHPAGKQAEQARIRIEAFALGSAPRTAPQTPEEEAASRERPGVPALQLASGVAATPPAPQMAQMPENPADTAPSAPGLAQPGEAAQPADAAPLPAPASAPAPGAEEGSSPANGYGVQLGAFGNPASAESEWQRLQGRFGAQLSGLAPRIVLASTDSGDLYRLQAPANGEAQARAICDSLREQAQSCVPVLPRSE